MTPMRTLAAALAALALLLAGCSDDTPSGNREPASQAPDASEAPAADVPITPRAVGALTIQQTQTPKSISAIADLTAYGAGAVGAEVVYRGGVLHVVTGANIPAALTTCAGAACATVKKATIGWDAAAGLVWVSWVNDDSTNLAQLTGVSVPANPVKNDESLPVWVSEMVAVVKSKELALETSADWIAAGESLPFWQE